jgi:hypothetical protein
MSVIPVALQTTIKGVIADPLHRFFRLRPPKHFSPTRENIEARYCTASDGTFTYVSMGGGTCARTAAKDGRLIKEGKAQTAS